MSWFRRRAHDGPSFLLGDPALAEYLGLGGRSDAGVRVTEASSLGLTAVFRSVALIAGSVAQLPLKTYRRRGESDRVRVPSFLDNPGGEFLTPFELKELVLVHLLLHGNAFLLHVYNGAGAIESLFPVHPSLVLVKADKTVGRLFITNADGAERVYTSQEMTHIPALGTDGLRGLSPISVMRNALGTAIAGDQAAARMFSSGLLLGGIVSSDETLTLEAAEEIKAGLKAKLSGSHNAGDIAVVNASLKFSPWTMSAEDAQFVESRKMQVTEVARIFGVPKVLLAEDGASTWGSGIAELNRGLARYTLMPWTTRVEERLSRLLPFPRFVEFDYSGIMQGTPTEEIALLTQQLEAGMLTINEVRAIRNMPPLPETPEVEDAGPIFD